MPFGILLLMRNEIDRSVEIPGGTEIELKNTGIIARKNGKEVAKKINFSNKVKVTKEGNMIKIKCKKPTRRESSLAGTIEAHIKNAVNGLEKNYLYKLEICNVHFPMNVKVDGKKVFIKNFLGEKLDRVAEILEGVEVIVKGNMIELKSANIDAVGQSAANLELVTKVRNRDRRVFQDGIYLIEKGGKIL